jgi:dienelactone hydrolase
MRTEPLVDTGRDRALPTRVVAPVDGQAGRPYPLLVFAHGSGGLGDGYDQLFRTWSAAGYVVAAPAFPVATADALQGAWIDDLPNMPADVSFVITELLRLSADGPGPLRGTIDPERIGLAGHSMGAMITLAVAGNTCCHDGRVKAAVVLAGREVQFGSGQFWARIRTPVLLVHGDQDTNVTYTDGRRAYADAPPPRFLLTILGGDHGRPYTADTRDPGARLVADVTLDFLDQYLGHVPGALSALTAHAGAPGVATLEQER